MDTLGTFTKPDNDSVGARPRTYDLEKGLNELAGGEMNVKNETAKVIGGAPLKLRRRRRDGREKSAAAACKICRRRGTIGAEL